MSGARIVRSFSGRPFHERSMHLYELRCKDFRCLEDLRLEPSPGLNIIRGRNAQGKTSILEAILYAATSKSHRTSSESELVAHGTERFSLALKVQRADRAVDIDANWSRGAKRFKVNGVAQSRISDILGQVRVVFFSPEDVGLVKDGPSVRRKFLDMELSQLNRNYLHALQRYRQALRQRNELLRSGKAEADLVCVWDEQLAEHGETIRRERADFVRELGVGAGRAYDRISGGEPLEILYEGDVPPGDSLSETLQLSLDSDIRRKTTTRGPHRDDVQIKVNLHPARTYGSQGQQKSIALAIKLAELELVKHRTKEYPILMLDEVLSELDDNRAERLFGAISGDVQCLLTTTELDDRRNTIPGEHEDFFVDCGRLSSGSRAKR